MYTLSVTGNTTITLPTVAANTGRIIVIQKFDGNATTLTIDGEGAERINSSSTKTLTNIYTTYTLQSDGTRWRIISQIL